MEFDISDHISLLLIPLGFAKSFGRCNTCYKTASSSRFHYALLAFASAFFFCSLKKLTTSVLSVIQARLRSINPALLFALISAPFSMRSLTISMLSDREAIWRGVKPDQLLPLISVPFLMRSLTVSVSPFAQAR